MADQPACANCRFWDRSEVGEYNHAVTVIGAHSLPWEPESKKTPADRVKERVNARFGLCTGINEGWDLTVEQAERVLATVWDGSSYRASLNTRDDFFCALFEQRTHG